MRNLVGSLFLVILVPPASVAAAEGSSDEPSVMSRDPRIYHA